MVGVGLHHSDPGAHHVNVVLLPRHDVVQQVLGLEGGQVEKVVSGLVSVNVESPSYLTGHHLDDQTYPQPQHPVEEVRFSPDKHPEVDEDLLSQCGGGDVELTGGRYEVSEFRGSDWLGDDQLIVRRESDRDLLLSDEEVGEAEGEVLHLLAEQAVTVADNAPLLGNTGRLEQLPDHVTLVLVKHPLIETNLNRSLTTPTLVLREVP